MLEQFLKLPEGIPCACFYCRALQKKLERTLVKNNLQSRYLKIFLIVTTIVVVLIACNPRPPLQNGTLTIGVLLTNDSSAADYKDLKTYLEKNLRPSLGQVLQVQIDAQKDSLQEFKKNVANNKWDIVFTVSPVVSLVAEDNHYEFFARMYPDYDSYLDATIFVRKDSPIQSLDDITPDKTIALGEFYNAPAFYIPIYYLYGKTIRVNLNNSPAQIIKKVESGEADAGAWVYPIVKKYTSLRPINQSLSIPVAGVYLSPTDRINKREHELIKKVFLDAPLKVQKKANYMKSEKLDYQQFRKIVERVENVLECTNFNQNPMKLFCPLKTVTASSPNGTNTPDIQSGTVKGEVSSYTYIDSQKIRLTLQGEDGKVYSVVLPRNVLNQVPNAPPPQGLKLKSIEVRNAQKSQIRGTIELQVTKPEQLRIL